ncbi:hypothetical protein GIB67_029200 [Kingdonia uniflora]|uniref:Uncharacterized protein n=1 Tax=Kingdonia uniflora TaxID=39325 RepID=A0A7J7NAZ7_9MAGN|nr:hypothetical protein GIB67_029200 [Kingdonia uniflora]
MSLDEIESRLGSLLQVNTISQLKSGVWKEWLEAIVLLNQEVEVLQDLDQSAELLIRLLCVVLGWGPTRSCRSHCTHSFIGEKISEKMCCSLPCKHVLPSGEDPLYGVDVNIGGITDSFANFIWEPAVVKINVLIVATKVVCLVLGVDEMVKNPEVYKLIQISRNAERHSKVLSILALKHLRPFFMVVLLVFLCIG